MMRKKWYFGAFCAKLGLKDITFKGNTVIPIYRGIDFYWVLYFAGFLNVCT